MKRIDPQPIPEESGQLGPPRRRPPTAVGVEVPPPDDGDAAWMAYRQARARRGGLLGQALAAMGGALRDLYRTVVGAGGPGVPAGAPLREEDGREAGLT